MTKTVPLITLHVVGAQLKKIDPVSTWITLQPVRVDIFSLLFDLFTRLLVASIIVGIQVIISFLFGSPVDLCYRALMRLTRCPDERHDSRAQHRRLPNSCATICLAFDRLRGRDPFAFLRRNTKLRIIAATIRSGLACMVSLRRFLMRRMELTRRLIPIGRTWQREPPT